MHKILQTLELLIIKHFAVKKKSSKTSDTHTLRHAQNTAKKCMMFTKGIHKQNNR